MWRIRKWPFLSAVARQTPFLEQYTKADTLYTPPLSGIFWTAALRLIVGRLKCSCCAACRRVAGGMLLPCSGILLHRKIFSTSFIWVMLGYAFIKVLRGGQLSLGYICAVWRPVHNRLLIWVPQAVGDHKKIQHQVHRRRSLQGMALVKDTWDICFHVYSNELLVLYVNSACYWLLCKDGLWVMCSAARKGIWEVLESKTWFFSPIFSLPHLSFLKKPSNIFLEDFCFSLARAISVCCTLPLCT